MHRMFNKNVGAKGPYTIKVVTFILMLSDPPDFTQGKYYLMLK